MEQTDIAIILSYVSIVSVLIPIVTFLFYPSESPVAFLLSILIMISLIADIANECFVRAGNTGFLIVNSYYIVMYILLVLIYQKLLPNKILVNIIIVTYVILLGINLLLTKSFKELHHWIRMFECITLVFFSLSSYLHLLKKPLQNKNLNYLIHWINMGVLFYFFLNLYLFTISNYVLKHVFKDDAMVIWGFHSINNIVKNILFAIALFEAGRGIRVIRSNIQ